MPSEDNQHEVQLGEVFQQSRANAQQIVEMRTEFGTAISDLRKAISNLAQTIGAETRPNFSTMAAWAGILLTIIAMVATPIAYYLNHSLTTLDLKLQKEYQLITDTMGERVKGLNTELANMDIRLQREFIAANDSVKRSAEALTTASADKHKALLDHVSRLESNADARTRDDFEELRKWRNGELKGRK